MLYFFQISFVCLHSFSHPPCLGIHQATHQVLWPKENQLLLQRRKWGTELFYTFFERTAFAQSCAQLSCLRETRKDTWARCAFSHHVLCSSSSHRLCIYLISPGPLLILWSGPLWPAKAEYRLETSTTCCEVNLCAWLLCSLFSLWWESVQVWGCYIRSFFSVQVNNPDKYKYIPLLFHKILSLQALIWLIRVNLKS